MKFLVTAYQGGFYMGKRIPVEAASKEEALHLFKARYPRVGAIATRFVITKSRQQRPMAFQQDTGGRNAQQDLRLFAERLDCTVRALAIATPWTYAEAHQILAQAGRKPRTGFHFKPWMDTHLNRPFHGVVITRLPEFWWPTLGRFIDSKPKGNYLIGIARHVMAVTDGVIRDSFYSGRRCRILRIYKVELA